MDSTRALKAGDDDPAREGKAAEVGPWRDRGLLVYRDGAYRRRTELPARCMRCNAPTRRIEEVNLRWQPKGRAGGVIGAIEVLARTETVRVRLPRCERCKPWVNPRVVSTLFGILAAGLAVGSLFTNFNGNRPGPLFKCLGAAGVAFVVAIVAAVWPREARVLFVEWPFVWLAGFSREYLAGLPVYAREEGRAWRTTEVDLLRRRVTRWRLAYLLVALVAFGMAGLSLHDWLKVHAVRNDPLVSGRVVRREPTKLWSGYEGGALTIRMDDGTEARAVVGKKRMEDTPETVQFRYSGDPSREVFLAGDDSRSMVAVVIFVGAGLFFLLMLSFFGRGSAGAGEERG